MPLSREDVFKKIDQHQQELRNLGVLQLRLFGSAARNESRKTSDLDFVVQLDVTSFDAYMDVKLRLEDIFHCSVDLVLADTIKPQLRDNILQEAIHAPGF